MISPNANPGCLKISLQHVFKRTQELLWARTFASVGRTFYKVHPVHPVLSLLNFTFSVIHSFIYFDSHVCFFTVLYHTQRSLQYTIATSSYLLSLDDGLGRNDFRCRRGGRLQFQPVQIHTFITSGSCCCGHFFCFDSRACPADVQNQSILLHTFLHWWNL